MLNYGYQTTSESGKWNSLKAALTDAKASSTKGY